jgi:hypothetical protein
MPGLDRSRLIVEGWVLGTRPRKTGQGLADAGVTCGRGIGPSCEELDERGVDLCAKALRV